jgi:hypothetical protein
VAVPSSAKAAAPNSTRRLLTVGGGLGTCNILPLPVRRQRGDKPCVVSTQAALCIRWMPQRVCRLPQRAWRIVDGRFQVAPQGIVSGQLKMRSSP